MVQQRSCRIVHKLVSFLVPDAQLERRLRQRLRTDVDVILSGYCGQSTARGVDLSRRGMGVLADQSVEPGTLLFVRLPDCGMMGFAHVRRCALQPEDSYMLGLEFREPLTRDRSDAVRPDRGAWQFRYAGRDNGWSVADDIY